jgi:hypothetical protein
MSVQLNGRLDENVTTMVVASDLLLTTTVGDTDYVSLKGFRKLQIVISIADGTTVTGSTITLKQATDVAAGGEKALAFTRMLASVDYPTTALAETAVTSSTFTTQTTNSKNSLYIIDVDADSLDVANGFDCVRLDGTGHAATASRGVVVMYNLYGARYTGTTRATAIAD